MIDIRALPHLDLPDLRRLIAGYTTREVYHVAISDHRDRIAFTLERAPLDEPYHKRYSYLDAELIARYERLLPAGFAFGAYDGEICVGIALAEPHAWNRSLTVEELHVDAEYQRQGIGLRLMDALEERARATGLRTIVCETQNTNVNAIDFYRHIGFALEAIDLSFYTNDDYPRGEIAIFMKKRLA